MKKGATQCGFCIPGMIMKAYSLLKIKPNPDREDIVKGLSQEPLPLPPAYTKIIEAVAYAAELITEGHCAAGAEKPNGGAVGVSVSRLDSPATVTGAAKYAADLKAPGMLYGKLLRAEHHHARIVPRQEDG